jgi:hypothetical protein
VVREPCYAAIAMRRAVMRLWARAQRGKPDPFTSVVLTVPVFLLYHLGILVIDQRNGVDWVSGLAFALLEASTTAYVAVTLGLAAALGLALRYLQRSGRLRPTALWPVVLESGLWAIAMLLSVGYATTRLTRDLAVPALASDYPLAQLGVVDKLVLAAGAGFHEELAFRVVLISGGALLLTQLLGLREVTAHVLAALGSALLFSYVHHLGPYGEPLALAPFVFRALAALYLTVVYAARGFAVAVYTHALYDVLIFFS